MYGTLLLRGALETVLLDMRHTTPRSAEGPVAGPQRCVYAHATLWKEAKNQVYQ